MGTGGRETATGTTTGDHQTRAEAENDGGSVSGAVTHAAGGSTGHGAVRLPGSEAAGSTEPADAAAAQKVKDDFLFEVVCDCIYNRERATFFAVAHRATMLVSVLLGSGGVALFARTQPDIAIVIGFIISAVASLSLVFDFAGLARWYGERRLAFHELAAKLHERPDNEKKLRGEWIRFTAEGGAEFAAAEAEAYNKTVLALGRQEGYMFILPWHHHFFRHVWPFRGAVYMRRADQPPAE